MPETPSRDAERDREELAALFLRLRSRESLPVKLMEAVEALPRRVFFPDITRDLYADQTLPIPCGETADSVANVMRAIAALKVQPDSRILEVGTGSGYVTALLARLGARVTSLERYRTLKDAAAERLKRLGLTNVTLHLEDGREGFRENAPYDRIILHGAVEETPRAFLEQMASPGILLAAIGPSFGEQILTRHHKAGSRFEVEPLHKVRTQALKPGIALVL